MSMVQSKGGKRRLVADINVTPLVDVMLVLLIIFMITAPMMTRGINLEVQKTSDAPQKQNDQPLVISISQDSQIQITLNETKVTRDQLMQKLAAISEEDKKNKPLYIRADPGVPYGPVAALFADARDAGFLKLTPAINNPQVNHGHDGIKRR